MTQDPPLTMPPVRRSPRFTVASWVVLLGGLLLTYGAYRMAVHYQDPIDWFPGVGEALIGIAAAAVLSFACGLTAFFRRERWSWAALLPFLAGLGTILYFAWKMATRR